MQTETVKISCAKACYHFLDAVIAGDWSLAAYSLEAGEVDSDGFTDFVAEQDIAPFLDWKLSQGDGFRCLPAWIRINLLAFQRRDREHRDRLLELLIQLAARAREERLDFLLLKGPHFSQRFFGDLNARRIRDLDLIARPGQMTMWETFLLAQGFESEDSKFYPRQWLNRLLHARSFDRDGLSVDLHSNFRLNPAYRIAPQKVWNDSQELEVLGTVVSIPSDEDSLLLLLVSIAGDLQLGKLRAKSLIDLHAVVSSLEKNDNWADIMNRRSIENLHSISVNVLTLMRLCLPNACKFPRLDKELTRHQGLVTVESSDEALSLLLSGHNSVAGRRWFLDIYPGNRWQYLMWLAIKAPARQGLFNTLQRSLKSLRAWLL